MELSVCVHCGDAVFKSAFKQRLAGRGLLVCADAKMHLLIDRPLGWATLEHPNFDLTQCVVLSDNPCPTYQLDIINKQPAALIHLSDEDALLLTLKSVAKGSVVYPKVTTILTLAERKTLRLVALGYTNLEIAGKRGVTERTVKNSLVEIYKKLNLHSRVEVSHYYLGNWHLIKSWQQSPSS